MMNGCTDQGSPSARYSDEINVFHYWNIVKKYWRMIAAIVTSVCVLAVLLALNIPNTYRAESVIIPISAKGSGGLAQMASQLGGFAQLAGVGLSGQAGDVEKFMAILRSRTLTESVVQRENLMPILYEKDWDAEKGTWKTKNPKKQPTLEDAVRQMRSLVSVADDKKNKTIRITGEFEDPAIAARVVNTYVAELQRFINENSLTTAKRNRLFIEGQLAQNKAELLEAGKEINEFYRAKGISSAEARIDVPVTNEGSHARNENVATFPESGGDAVSTTSLLANNFSEVIAADTSSQINTLESQKAELEQKMAEIKVVKSVPQQVYLTYLMLHRELLGKVNALLTTQYEMAKIEEAKDDLAFQIIDRAVPPIKKFSPKRAQICIMSFMVSFFFAIILALFRDYFKRMKMVSRSHI